MAHITWPEILICRFCVFDLRIKPYNSVTDIAEKFIQGCAGAISNIIYLINSFFICSAGGEQVGLNAIVNIAEISAGFSIAVDIYVLSFDQGGKPFWHDSGIGAVRILAFSKDIEIS